MTHLGLVFVDGVGVGPPGPDNPLSIGDRALFAFHEGTLAGRELTGLPTGWAGSTIDATLGVPGLPQSASGQTALLTGVNASAHLGHHQSAIPGRGLRELLGAGTLFSRLAARGASVVFANPYGPSFIDRLRPDRPPRRASATTVATWGAGIGFRTTQDLARGEAVSHDITGEMLRAHGVDAAIVTPETAGLHLAHLVSENAFVFFEHFLTDLVGHGRIDTPPAEVLDRLERFVISCASALDPSDRGLIVTSDHGNLEDLSVTGHTRYPVPLLVWGRARSAFDPWPEDLTGIAPACLRALR